MNMHQCPRPCHMKTPRIAIHFQLHVNRPIGFSPTAHSDVSLSQRLRRLRRLETQAPVTLPSLDQLTLEELATETIAFGQKYKGRQHQDQEWIQLMVSRQISEVCGASGLSHRTGPDHSPSQQSSCACGS